MDSDEVQRFYTKKASLYHFLFLDFLGGNKKVKRFFQERDYVRPHMKILDAGCGTGNVTRALFTIAQEREYEDVIFHAFDLTKAMLDLFRQWVEDVGARQIYLRQADVLHLEELPFDWSGYDLIVSSAMLEYLSKEDVRRALSGLKRLLKKDGRLVVFITKRTVLTRWFIGWWWKAHTYDERELRQIFLDVGFRECNIMRELWHSLFAVEVTT